MAQSTLSPNQLDKRAQIIEAAKAVLLRDGLAAATTRTVAEESPLTRSAIHYYFASIDEIVDAAMANHLEVWLANLRAVAAEHDDALERFWAVSESYVRGFGENPRLALLWFDYAIRRVQEGRPEPAEAIDVAIRQLMAELLDANGCADAEARSRALTAYMIGTTLRHAIHPTSFDDVTPELASLSGLRPLSVP